MLNSEIKESSPNFGQNVQALARAGENDSIAQDVIGVLPAAPCSVKQEQERECAINKLISAIQEVENIGLIPLVVIENQGFEGDEFDETGYESVIRVTTENINFVEKEYVPF